MAPSIKYKKTNSTTNDIFDFFDLPRELGDKVYRYLLSDDVMFLNPGWPSHVGVMTAIITDEKSNWRREGRRPHLAMRQTCKAARDEMNEAISQDFVLNCDTDLCVTRSPIESTAKIFTDTIRRVQLVIFMACPAAEICTRWDWLGEFKRVEEYKICVLANEDRRVTQRFHVLRGLVADVYSHIPKAATVSWPEEESEDVKSSEWRKVDAGELRAIAVQMSILQGCLLEDL